MSFRLKTILGVALIEAVLLFILVWSGLRYIESSNEREFIQRAWATVKSFAVTSKDAVLATDLASLESFVAEMMTYPGVRYARVRDMDNLILAQEGDPALLQRTFVTDHNLVSVRDGVFDTYAEIEEVGSVFGRVELGLSVAGLQQVITDARNYSTSIALIEMGLVALFSFFLGVYLTRQLANLTEASERIAKGELGFQVPIRGKDELATTARAFNLMSQQVSRFYQQVADREQNLRTVLENIQDGILTARLDGRLLSLSPAASRIFGYADREVARLELTDLLAPQDWAKLAGQLTDPGSVVFGSLREVTGRHRTTGDFPMELTLTRTEQGEHEILVGVVRNISQRKQTEERLRLRERIISASSLGVVIADARSDDLPMVYVNPAFETITGYRAEEVLGSNCRFLQGPDTEPESLNRLRSALREGREARVLLRNYRKDGQPFWNELLITPIRDEQGKLTHYVGLQHDVTERVESERRLAEHEAHLRGVLDATHDAIIVADERGLIESCNRGCEQMFGYRVAELVGRNVAVLIPPPHHARHDAYLRTYRETGVSHILGREREFQAQRANGERFPIALRVNQMHKAQRRFYIGVIHDITERKQKENALQLAKQAAEQAAAAKSQFLANMSHEIRTPMQGVLGALEMLRDTPLNPSQTRYLETANSSAEVLLTVIDEILDFSRLEAGKLRIETLDFDPRKAVEDVTAMLSQQALERKLELVCYIEPRVPERLRGDPIRLRQVLINLVSNALKFTPAGEVVVSLSVAEAAAQQTILLFEVKDTGIGIPARQQDDLFEAFIQADGSTSRRFGGSGLGLSIARRLVDLMGGEIGVESCEGQGSRFWFQLPFAHGSRPMAPSYQNFNDRRILMVDDNATNRIILHRYLTGWGCAPGSAAEAGEALAKLQDSAMAGQPYHLAILDYQLPGMNGAELAKQIRLDEALRDMQLIMLSSVGDAEELDAALEVDIRLTKPLRQSDLHDAIATLFGERTRPLSVGHERSSRAVNFHGQRVLLVEDNPLSQSLGQEMLRRCGLETQVASTGREALQWVQQASFDIILMDVQMPQMDGYEATARILQWEAETSTKHTPIIALTAHALPQDRQRCLEAGMDDYLVKPYDQESLSNIIFRWLTSPALPPGQTVQDAVDQVFETSKLQQIKAMMGDSFSRLLEQFRDDVTQQLSLVASALTTHDHAGLQDAVHRIKNNAGDLGALALFDTASVLERQLQSGAFDEVLGRQLLDQGERVLAAIAQRLTGASP